MEAGPAGTPWGWLSQLLPVTASNELPERHSLLLVGAIGLRALYPNWRNLPHSPAYRSLPVGRDFLPALG